MGRLVDRLIPMKVPLGARFDSHIAPEHRFNISDAVAMARHAVEGVRFEGVVPHESEEPGQPPVPRRVELAAEVALVIDLTNSSRYYDAQQWMKHGLQYIKASGRGCCAAGAAQAGRGHPAVASQLHSAAAGMHPLCRSRAAAGGSRRSPRRSTTCAGRCRPT